MQFQSALTAAWETSAGLPVFVDTRYCQTLVLLGLVSVWRQTSRGIVSEGVLLSSCPSRLPFVPRRELI